MNLFAIFGFCLGSFGCILAFRALDKVSQLQAELKRLKILDEKFNSDKQPRPPES